jgi:hypothetical protein
MKAPLEKDVQRVILQYLRLLGAWAVRVNSGGMVSEYRGRKRFMRFNDADGCPDVLVCLAGRFVGVEVKRPGGRPTEKQLAALDAIRKAGGLAFVASSVADVERALKAEGLA